jgi:hypothetical protein
MYSVVDALAEQGEAGSGSSGRPLRALPVQGVNLAGAITLVWVSQIASKGVFIVAGDWFHTACLPKGTEPTTNYFVQSQVI